MRQGGGAVVVVVGARGGVGASTLAALLAARAVRADRSGRSGHPRRTAPRVGLLDLDRGGGIEVLLGLEGAPGARWADLGQVRTALDPEDLDGVLPTWRGVEVLSADRRPADVGPGTVDAVVHGMVERCGVLVVDVPADMLLTDVGGVPGPAAPVLDRRTDLVVVTGQDVLGVAGALALRPALDDGAAHLVLRRRVRATVAPLEAAYLLDLPLLAMLPTDRRVAAATDRGLGPVVAARSRLGRAVERVAGGVLGG